MMLELAADMPEMLADIGDWRPKSYQEHFEDSVFSHKELAVAAYDHAPREYREPFDETIADLNRLIAEAVPRLSQEIEIGEPEAVKSSILVTTRVLQSRIETASAIVNGAKREQLVGVENDEAAVMDQADIDALFD